MNAGVSFSVSSPERSVKITGTHRASYQGQNWSTTTSETY
jgi:hypothetical protein